MAPIHLTKYEMLVRLQQVYTEREQEKKKEPWERITKWMNWSKCASVRTQGYEQCVRCHWEWMCTYKDAGKCIKVKNMQSPEPVYVKMPVS